MKRPIDTRLPGILLWLLCACLVSSGAPIKLPAELSMNADAGRGNWVIVPLRLTNGKELQFILDTGCPHTILDESRVSELGAQLGRTNIWLLSGEKKAGVYMTPQLYLGGVRLIIDSNVLACDVHQLMTRRGQALAGILGMDCLRNYCVQLDFAAGKIRFLNSDNLKTTDLGAPFDIHYIGLQNEAGPDVQPSIWTASLAGGSATNTVIDTGFNLDGLAERTAIKQAAAPSHSGNVFTRMKHFMAVEGLADRAVELRECAWEHNTYTNMIVGKAPDDSPSWIGLRFLARHLVTLDFPDRKLYLKQLSIGPVKENQPEQPGK